MAEHANRQQDSTADTSLGCFTPNAVWLVATASISYFQHTGVMHSASDYAAWLLQEVGQKVAMHAVAMKPRYLSPDTVPAEALEGSPDAIPPHACLWVSRTASCAADTSSGYACTCSHCIMLAEHLWLIVSITAVCYCCAAEKQVLRDQAKTAGSGGKPKPANIIEKIMSGRINKV